MKNLMKKQAKTHGTGFYYMALIFVILIWSTTPVINPYFYKHISPTICTFISGLVAVISLIPIVGKKFSLLNKNFLKVAIPTGLINSAASIVQKIGLLYTTPSRYAFLENLSCVVVPALMFVFIRKKPNAFKIIAAILCLGGCFLLAGGNITEGGGFGIGEILCATAGILYGVNIAATGAFAKNLYAPLYVMIHMIVHTLTSGLTAIALGNIHFNGAPISPIYFEWNLPLILMIVCIAVLSHTVCWIIRTNVMKHLDATVVAVMMPCSAVITGILSILLGMDTLTPTLLGGAALMFSASVLSGIGNANASFKMPKIADFFSKIHLALTTKNNENANHSLQNK